MALYIYIRRLHEEDELLDETYRREKSESFVTKQQEQHTAEAESTRPGNKNNNIIMPVIKVKRKKDCSWHTIYLHNLPAPFLIIDERKMPTQFADAIISLKSWTRTAQKSCSGLR